MKVKGFRRVEGAFALAAPEEGIPAVRLIEEGDVRVVLEASFAFGSSRLLLRYLFPWRGTEVGIEVLVNWGEKDRMLKLSLPCRLRAPRFMGQVAFGADELPSNGDEAVAQKWVALVSEADDCALSVVNDGTYGSDFSAGELRLSLLRSPAYAADTREGKLVVAQDRHIPRQDQGERFFRFWIDAGPAVAHLEGLGRRALVHNETPYALAYFPPGTGRRALAGPRLSDAAVELAAFKKTEDGPSLTIRLFEPTGRKRTTTLGLPFAGLKTRVTLGPFEIKTLRFDPRRKTFTETDLLERPRRKAK